MRKQYKVSLASHSSNFSSKYVHTIRNMYRSISMYSVFSRHAPLYLSLGKIHIRGDLGRRILNKKRRENIVLLLKYELYSRTSWKVNCCEVASED